MRLVLAAILVIVLPAFSAAQSGRQADEPASLPTIGLPLPQIGLPLPTLGLPARTPAPRPRNGGRPPRGGGKGHKPPAVVFIGPAYYPWDDAPEPQAPAPAPDPQPPAEPYQEPAPVTGTLQLEIQPATGLQLFADGFYLGTSEDLHGALSLEAGPHRVEIRSPGYETATLDVKVEAGRTITYRGALTRTDAKGMPEPPARIEPAPKKPVYFIPGCYLGNVPPKEAGLPATCDLSRAVVVSQ